MQNQRKKAEQAMINLEPLLDRDAYVYIKQSHEVVPNHVSVWVPRSPLISYYGTNFTPLQFMALWKLYKECSFHMEDGVVYLLPPRHFSSWLREKNRLGVITLYPVHLYLTESHGFGKLGWRFSVSAAFCPMPGDEVIPFSPVESNFICDMGEVDMTGSDRKPQAGIDAAIQVWAKLTSENQYAPVVAR